MSIDLHNGLILCLVIINSGESNSFFV